MAKAVGIALGTISIDVTVMCDRESMAISGGYYLILVVMRR